MRVSLGKRIRSSGSFRCFGVKPDWGDYSPEAREAVEKADEVFYPSPLYEDIFLALGKKTFPRNYYAFMGNKIRQTNLFQFLGISHPRTRIYYGADRMARIGKDFPYPFIAKAPIGSSMGEGVYLVDGDAQLQDYLRSHHPAYIQEFLAFDRDLRVVLIKGTVVHSYWRVRKAGEFRDNVAQGGRISFESIPDEAVEFAIDVAARCGFDEVGLDICHADGRYYVIEANMVFGLEGFRKRKLDLYRILGELETAGLL